MLGQLTLALAALVALSSATPVPRNPYSAVSSQWPPAADGLEVDLGYGIYHGYHNSTSELNTWKGIRYAAAPLGSQRFQAPKVPAVSRQAENATAAPPTCPQAGPELANSLLTDMFKLNGPISEDCLFLNVYAPDDARNLPVFVWIHGGGYEQGGAVSYDPSSLVNTNNNEFVAVVIQYRLGAFGFLSSEEVRQKGALNAGLLDQQMTLQWVQKYIGLFGGDASRVTIAGESAGGGSVLNHVIAYGGAQGTQLWSNAITASPSVSNYFPYNEPNTVDQYYEFASLAGCGRNQSSSTFTCLQSASTTALSAANAQIASSALLGIFAWRPVIDHDLIRARPSVALAGRTNGQRLLTGNNANEGYIFTPQNISTAAHLTAYLHTYFPRLTPAHVAQILALYPTDGHSDLASGYQHVANAFYGELAYACPSYWLAEAFAAKGSAAEGSAGGLAGRAAAGAAAAYQYQFSPTPSFHGLDILYAFPRPSFPSSEPVRAALQGAWGEFVARGVAGAGWPMRRVSGSEQLRRRAGEVEEPRMWNLNATGGTEVERLGFRMFEGGEVVGGSVGAEAWEGGRGARCEVLRGLGDVVGV